MECNQCEKKFAEVSKALIPLPMPPEVLSEPSQRIFSLWQEARVARDRYMTELANEAAIHDHGITTPRLGRMGSVVE